MGKAYLVVRAVMADAPTRADFDKWYSAEPLRDAMEAFATRGWCGWSRTDWKVTRTREIIEAVDEIGPSGSV